MKRAELIRALKKHGCRLHRDNGKHTVWVNKEGAMATVPRHAELNKFTAKSIYEALGLETDGVSFS